MHPDFPTTLENNRLILAEAKKFDDIIIGNFKDTYENLPLKTFLGYQFYSDFCSDHDGIVQFIDDDTFVRFDQMEEILQNRKQIVCLKVRQVQVQLIITYTYYIYTYTM